MLRLGYKYGVKWGRERSWQNMAKKICRKRENETPLSLSAVSLRYEDDHDSPHLPAF